MKKIIFISNLKSVFQVICLAVAVALPSGVGAQEEQRQDPDQEQPEAEDRRVKRLRDSLATDPDAEWVPGMSTEAGEEQLRRKLLLGDRAFQAGDLLEPPNANALEFFQEALEIDAGNVEALDGIQRIADTLMELAQGAQATGDRTQALSYIGQIRSFRPDHPGLGDMEDQISQRAEIASLLAAGDQFLAGGQLTEPAGGNALESYRAVLAIDSANSRARQGVNAVETGLLERARAASEGNQFNEAFGWIDAAAAIGATGEVESVRAAVLDRQDQRWQSQLQDARDQVENDRLEEAERTLASLRSGGFQSDDLAELDEAIANGYILRRYQPGMELTDDAGLQLVVIGRGEFTMGSPSRESGRSDNEGPQQTVRFKRPFAISRHEVTVGQFRRFVDATGYVADSEKNGQSTIYAVLAGNLKDEEGVTWRQDFQGRDASDDDPVVHVSWKDATAFADWWSEQTGESYRLPSEAEFEYALRGGTTSRYWWGNDRPSEKVENLTGDGDKIGDRWEWPNPFRRYRDGHWGPAPVGSFLPNPYGLYDAGGNAMEWVADCYQGSLEGQDPGGGPREVGGCTLRVLKGGSWASPPDLVRSAYRSSAQDTRTSCLIGFRLARDL